MMMERKLARKNSWLMLSLKNIFLLKFLLKSSGLKNRKKEEWREKQEQLDADGQAIQNVKDILISVRETVQLKGGIIKDDDGTNNDE